MRLLQKLPWRNYSCSKRCRTSCIICRNNMLRCERKKRGFKIKADELTTLADMGSLALGILPRCASSGGLSESDTSSPPPTLSPALPADCPSLADPHPPHIPPDEAAATTTPKERGRKATKMCRERRRDSPRSPSPTKGTVYTIDYIRM
jgi:hypothetical protein